MRRSVVVCSVVGGISCLLLLLALQSPAQQVQTPAGPGPDFTKPAATEHYELPDDPTIPKKFDSPEALIKWLDEIEKLYVPPKWSEKPKLADDQREKLENHRKAAMQRVVESQNVEEFQTRMEAVLQLDRQLHGVDSKVVLETLQIAAHNHESNANWKLVEQTQQQLIDLSTRVFGFKSYQVQDAKRALTNIERLQKQTATELADLQKADNTEQQVTELFGQGKFSAALPLAESVLAIREKILGSGDPDTATSLNNLALLFNNIGDYARAEPLLTRALNICEKALGPDHPYTATSLNNLADLYQNIGDYARAEPLYTRALKISEKARGPEHPDTATSLNNLANLYQDMGDYAWSEAIYTRALNLREKALGPDHPHTASSLNNLAALYRNMCDYEQAEPLLTRALKITEKALGSDHPDTATSLNNLAALYIDKGDYARAEPLLTRALKITEKALGSDHPDTATSLNNLAALYIDMGDYARAEPLFTRALKITEKAFGPGHPHTAQGLNNLAELYRNMGDYVRAEPLYTNALKIREKALGTDHPNTATSLNNLAGLYIEMGDYARAEPLFNRALKIRKKALGPDHPNTAAILNNLAGLYIEMGDYARAEPLFNRALKITEKALGLDHPSTAQRLNNLSYLHVAQQQPRLALPQFKQAFQIQLKHFHVTTAIQSERQQREFANKFQINGYLQALLEAKVSVAEHFAGLMLRKGLVFRRQQALRSVRDNPLLQVVFTDWQRTLTQLSQASFETTTNEKERQRLQTRVQELTIRKEELEAQLAKESQEFAAAQRFTTLHELQAAMPKNAVLIDCLEYSHYFPANMANKSKSSWEPRLAAFIVPASGEIKLLELGKDQSVQEQLSLWLGPKRSVLGNSQEAQAAGLKLRQQLWEPLIEHLPKTKLGEVPLVLISPDGVLNQIPWNALPGAKPGTYLIEEAALATIAVPQLLPGLLNPVTSREPHGKFLVLGNVNYDQKDAAPAPPAGNPVAAALRGADAKNYVKLPGTAMELKSLEKLYRDTHGDKGMTTLQQLAATKAAVQSAMPQHRYLHLATHGFFAPERFHELLAVKPKQALLGEQHSGADINPNLLSGVVLAGANKPNEDDDGILTAEEVLGLELRGVQLATLSACETGLGTVASGEGLLGLQRAFQVAGCQTVVATQWSVDDAATQALMEKFYENLWVKKLPKLQALRESQLWLLNDGPKKGLCPERGLGGTVVLKPNQKPSLYYWAPFVLSGDWR